MYIQCIIVLPMYVHKCWYFNHDRVTYKFNYTDWAKKCFLRPCPYGARGRSFYAMPNGKMNFYYLVEVWTSARTECFGLLSANWWNIMKAEKFTYGPQVNGVDLYCAGGIPVSASILLYNIIMHTHTLVHTLINTSVSVNQPFKDMLSHGNPFISM